jgi:glycosyltransferase involved in cell wall biosynthesis
VADPASVSVVIPAFNEAGAIAPVVRDLLATATWREVLVVDDGSTDGTASAAADAGARVLRHPYNKGNGASVKTGIRAASGDYILILDADGQHPPAEALPLVAALGDYDLVVGARAAGAQAGWRRRFGNAILNRLTCSRTASRLPRRPRSPSCGRATA